MIRRFILIFICMSSLCISGCFHSPTPFLPENTKTTQSYKALPENTNNSPALQVFIMYGDVQCNHVALRLHVTEEKSIFWDPAGGYGKDGSKKVVKRRDVISKKAPDLNDYLLFRTEIPTTALELFEWQIDMEKAERLYNALLKGTDKSHPAGKFDTLGIGLFCGAHISDFLSRFAGDIMAVKKVFYPHELAKQLYKQSPDRIFYVDFRGKVTIRQVQLPEP